MKQKFSLKVLLIAGVIALGGGFLFSILHSPLQVTPPRVATPTVTHAASPPILSSSVTPTPIVIQNDPEQVVTLYYQWYIECVKKHMADRETGIISKNKTIQESCPYNTLGILTTEFYNYLLTVRDKNPILCRNISRRTYPHSYFFDASQINSDGTRRILVHSLYGQGEDIIDQKMEVSLSIAGDMWKISSIVCVSS